MNYLLLMFMHNIRIEMSMPFLFCMSAPHNTKIQRLLTEMNISTMKSTYASVSHIQHQIDFMNME